MVRRIPTGIRLAAALFVALTLVFILAPLVVVAGVSVSESPFIAFPPKGFSLKWYAALVGSDDYLRAAWTSLRLALAVTVTVTLVGGLAAIGLARRRDALGNGLQAIFLSPLILPTIVLAIGLLILWNVSFGAVSFTALWVGHSVIALPYVVRTTLAVLGDADPHLEEAARTMGAGPLKSLVLVVLPQCLPGLAAGAFFAFNISFDEAVIALFLRTPDLVTLPIQIYNQIEFSPDPTIAAVSTLMIGITILLIAIVDRVVGIGRVAGH